jgi:hypothetical protein
LWALLNCLLHLQHDQLMPYATGSIALHAAGTAAAAAGLTSSYLMACLLQVVERQHKKAALAHEQEELYVLRQAQPLGREALAEQVDACLAGGSGGDAQLRAMLQQVGGTYSRPGGWS